MKRTYEKPGIYVESFAVAQSIAVGCAGAMSSTHGSPSFNDIGSCGWNTNSFVGIVWQQKPPCETKITDEQYEGVCYNNPNGNAIFGRS